MIADTLTRLTFEAAFIVGCDLDSGISGAGAPVIPYLFLITPGGMGGGWLARQLRCTCEIVCGLSGGRASVVVGRLADRRWCMRRIAGGYYVGACL